MNQQIDLSIIIVSWKVKDLLEKCLKSIFEQTQNIEFEIFVVDNDSQDGTVEMVKNKFSKVNLIANRENVGFAKANNQAIKLAKGKYVLLLNPDTEIFENTLEKMVDFMDQNIACGVAGCQLLNPDTSLQPSIRRFPRFSDQALILIKVHHFWPNLGVFRHYLAKDIDYGQVQEVDQVMGAFMMIRYEVIKKIGFLDENFFIWFEEVDYCKRTKSIGWKICYTPEVKIIHYYGQSFKQRLTLDRQKMFNRSMRYYFKKHHSIFAYLGIVILQPISLLLAWLSQISKLKK